MTPEQFVYWLQGVIEIGDVKSFDTRQTEIIKNHLALVFAHVDAPDPTGKLAAVHETGEAAHMIPGKLVANWHLVEQECSVCNFDWYSCKHGRHERRPRC